MKGGASVRGKVGLHREKTPCSRSNRKIQERIHQEVPIFFKYYIGVAVLAKSERVGYIIYMYGQNRKRQMKRGKKRREKQRGEKRMVLRIRAWPDERGGGKKGEDERVRGANTKTKEETKQRNRRRSVR